MPDASKEQAESFNELQRRTTSAECAARYLQTTAEFDVTEILPKIEVPTLVMHSRGDVQVSIEAGRELAAGIKAQSSSCFKATATFFLSKIRPRSGSLKNWSSLRAIDPNGNVSSRMRGLFHSLCDLHPFCAICSRS